MNGGVLKNNSLSNRPQARGRPNKARPILEASQLAQSTLRQRAYQLIIGKTTSAENHNQPNRVGRGSV